MPIRPVRAGRIPPFTPVEYRYVLPELKMYAFGAFEFRRLKMSPSTPSFRLPPRRKSLLMRRFMTLSAGPSTDPYGLTRIVAELSCGILVKRTVRCPLDPCLDCKDEARRTSPGSR